jgi:hypothetical protein
LVDDAHKGKHLETGNRLVNLPKKVELVGILPWAHPLAYLQDWKQVLLFTISENKSFLFYFITF